jgi:hypothetical protein
MTDAELKKLPKAAIIALYKLQMEVAKVQEQRFAQFEQIVRTLEENVYNLQQIIETIYPGLLTERGVEIRKPPTSQ